MEKIHVSGQRTPPPDWAKAHTEPKITPPQRQFLLDLIKEREADAAEKSGKIDLIMKCLRISEDEEEFGMSKAKASELITWFLARPKKPTEQDKAQKAGRAEDLEWQKALVDLPPGRYAIENNEGELRFYLRWQGRGQNSDRFALYVIHGPYESKLPRPAQVTIAQKILDAGVRKCALRYGAEIGECSNCGRRLTNRISRELAIGPICGGRMFGDEWKTEVKTKRAEIVARGEDPDEELE